VVGDGVAGGMNNNEVDGVTGGGAVGA